MPLATEPNLRQALTYEMDRQTPFRADDVFFDYRVTGRDREAGTLRVVLCVAPRSVVCDGLEPFVSRGLPPTGVDVLEGDMPAGFNLLPAEQRARVVNRQTRINWYLAGAAVLVLAVVMAESLYLRQAQLEQLDTRIEDLRAEAMQVQRIDNQIEEASASATFLLDQRAAMAPSVVVLTEVTSVLPDDTYLDRLLIGDGRVQMQGKSENAQRLIELINESERFEAASFRGPTRLDSRTQREIFDLNADIAAAGGE
jgi:general secretion pathway protein L